MLVVNVVSIFELKPYLMPHSDNGQMIANGMLTPAREKIPQSNAPPVTEPREFDFVYRFNRIQEVQVDGFDPETEIPNELLQKFRYLAGTITAYDHARGFAPISQTCRM
jgi:hypothetical protein